MIVMGLLNITFIDLYVLKWIDMNWERIDVPLIMDKFGIHYINYFLHFHLIKLYLDQQKLFDNDKINTPSKTTTVAPFSKGPYVT